MSAENMKIDMGKLIKKGSHEEVLLGKIDPARLPRHIAVIMDGNGRWARLRGKPRIYGHRAGIKSVRETVEASARLGVKHLTLYAFSTENWKRPQTEIKTLFALLNRYLKSEFRTLLKNNIKFNVIGRMSDLDARTQTALRDAERKTANLGGMVFNIALSYSGRAELLDAFKNLARSVEKTPRALDSFTEKDITDALYTAGQPDPDLLIRTSGEMRISNFLLWQIAYTEIYVASVLWPDFRVRELLEAIIDYQRRERRYGGV